MNPWWLGERKKAYAVLISSSLKGLLAAYDARGLRLTVRQFGSVSAALTTFATAPCRKVRQWEPFYLGARTRKQGDGVFAARGAWAGFVAKADSANGGGGSATNCSVLPE